MIKTFLLPLLLSIKLFGCATCSFMTPTADVDIKLDIKNKKLYNIDFVWTFSKVYTEELITQYDKNTNKILDPDELHVIYDIKKKYLEKKDMVTQIFFAQADQEEKKLNIIYENFHIFLKDKKLILTFNSKTDLYLKDKSMLSIMVEDDDFYFLFEISNVLIDNKEIFYKEKNDIYKTSLLISHTPFVDTNNTIEQKVQETSVKTVEQNQTKEEESFTLENFMKKSISKIKNLFESIKDEQSPLTYISLLLFAYIYGLIHALGPGHGKTLVASYFLTNDRSYMKALFVSLAIGIVHTFSAFLLTVAIYFFLDILFAQFVDDTVYFTTKISALIIIFIALYLLIKKYKAYKKIQEPRHHFSTTPHPSTCGCGSCKVDKDSTDAALIISAGIIPCPGTITIFIFSLSLGLYYAGFLSALIMSLGMSTVIYFSAVLSVFVRNKSSDANSTFKKFLEYGSLFVILTLGLILLFG